MPPMQQVKKTLDALMQPKWRPTLIYVALGAILAAPAGVGMFLVLIALSFALIGFGTGALWQWIRKQEASVGSGAINAGLTFGLVLWVAGFFMYGDVSGWPPSSEIAMNASIGLSVSLAAGYVWGRIMGLVLPGFGE